MRPSPSKAPAKVLLPLLVLVAGVALWFVSGAGDDPLEVAGGSGRSAAEEPTRQPEELFPAEPLTPGPEPVVEADPAEPAPADEDSNRRSVSTLPDGVEGATMSGTVVLFERDGVRRDRLSGHLQIVGSWDQKSHRFDVQVQEGRWKGSFPKGASLEFLGVTLEGQPAVLEPESARTVLVREGGSAAIIAAWPPAVVLRVVDATTGGELEDVSLYRHPRGTAHVTRPGHFEEGDRLVNAADSPITLPPGASSPGRSRVWVGAPDYAWTPFDLDGATDGEFRVELQPGGSLEVLLSGFVPESGAALRLFPDGEGRHIPVVDELLEEDTVSFDGIAGGKYSVRVEIGAWYRTPYSLGRLDGVVIPGGGEARISLALEPPPERPAPVPLEGILAFGSGGEVVGTRLVVARITTPESLQEVEKGLYEPVRHTLSLSQMEDVGSGRFAWKIEEGVPAGRYRLEVLPSRDHLTVDVGPEGLRDVHLDVTTLAAVSLVVLEVGSGAHAEVDRLSWRTVLPDGSQVGTASFVLRNGETFEFQAPLGRIAVRVQNERYQLTTETLEVGEGENRHTMSVAPVCALMLKLEDGDATVRPGTVKLEEVNGPGRMTRLVRTSEGARAELSGPGFYRVELSPIPGYEEVLPFDVLVRAGQVETVLIELMRL